MTEAQRFICKVLALAALAVAGLHPSTARAAVVSSPGGHLYGVSPGNKVVYRFALAADGLPATQPDGVLYLDGAIEPQGLAVDRVGDIFVADSILGVVDEYPAGATGHQKPISLLNLHQEGPDYLKMDGGGRLYVHISVNQDIAVFAKGAHGTDPPISVITKYFGNEFAVDYVIAKSGVLYKLVFAGPVEVYDTPLNNPVAPTSFLQAQGGFEFGFVQTLAYDPDGNKIYVEFQPKGVGYWGKVDFAVRPLPAPRAMVDPWILTGDCGVPSYSGVGGSIIVKNFLVVSCAPDGNTYVYRNDRFGRRHAVETVGYRTGIWELAVGP